MPIEFQMPKLGLTMEEGTIIEWLVAQDAEVEKGQPVLSIETDKVETEIESSAGGQLHQIAKVGEPFLAVPLLAGFPKWARIFKNMTPVTIYGPFRLARSPIFLEKVIKRLSLKWLRLS